jgi:hypothetical protein
MQVLAKKFVDKGVDRLRRKLRLPVHLNLLSVRHGNAESSFLPHVISK